MQQLCSWPVLFLHRRPSRRKAVTLILPRVARVARAGVFLAKVAEAQVSLVSPVTLILPRVARAGVSVARARARADLVTLTRIVRAGV